MMPKRIAIIGGGCAGTLVAAQILKEARGATHVILIERFSPPGRGVAYRTECEEHLLNVPAARMSAWPDDPDHFLRWVKAKDGGQKESQTVNAGDFLPRQTYGRYLTDVLEEAVLNAGSNATFESVAGEAIDLEEVEDGGRITLTDGRAIVADSVVLAIGNLPGEYPIRRSLPFYHGPNYVHMPWAPGALEQIGKSDDILVVGAGLTAVDIIVKCSAQGHRGVIHALSRRGIRPQAHRDALPPYPAFLAQDRLPTTVRVAFARLREEVRTATAGGLDWRTVIDAVRPYSQALWQGFSWNERARFMRHVRPFWEAHRHRIAPLTAATVQEAEAAGRLKFHAGRLMSLRDTSGGASVLVKVRGKADFMALRVAKVINCTGPRTDYSKYQHPLLINLLAAGLIGHDPLALGIAALPSGEVLRYNQKPMGWLFTIGAPLKGVLWESTAVPEIRVQALALARRVAHGVGSESRRESEN
jgi:uncharacterized NAD(P)/FAD-binding protein YdhS